MFEEHHDQYQTSFSRSQVYTWNIDGLNEYQIESVMHQILMYATVCQTNHNSEKDIVLILICGFMGSLKGWWKNYLTSTQRNKLLTSIKIETNAEGVEIQKPDILYTLVQSFVYHFIGTVSSNAESQRYLL